MPNRFHILLLTGQRKYRGMSHANTRRYANVNLMLDQRRSVPALNQQLEMFIERS